MALSIEVREKIIDVARQMFFSFGIKRVTVDEIAAELGIGKATLYEYFPSKSILVQAVMDEKRRGMEEFLQGVETRISDDTDFNFIELTKELITFGSNELAEMKEPFMREVQRSMPSFSIETDYYDLLRSIVGEMLTRGIREKVIRDDFNTQIFTEMIFCLVSNIVSNQDFATRFNVSRAEVMDTLVKVMVAGLLTDKGREAYIGPG